MDLEKVREVLSDEGFVKELLAMENEAEVQKALGDKGISISLEEIEMVGELIRKAASGEITVEQIEAAGSGELSEDELEQVAGGAILSGIIACLVLGAIGGGAVITTIETEGRW